MEMLKFGKFAALALAMAVAVGCSSKGGDNAGEGAGAVDPNAGYGANTGAVDGSLSEEAALRAITTFYFEYDSSDLKPEAMRALDVHAKDLKANGNRVVLEGNTDERGTREYNMALGERRAKAVQRYLVLQGVSPAQLEVVSYGEERPVATGNDEQSWAQNRRVELRK
ncbi:UNVERIFIED_ORG: peptidoglycan-associated lipoprotein [Pseudomonas parafulva]|jgi:peptidoglycan-associated lipoprotein|uniref:Peptidoglycan-associated lipoprotein n=2 Tax=Pseudomonas TaxID=286 RepID=A0AAJ0LKA5_9PSED|nr:MULTISPECIES: peptidoglycan-associated lipoprotein Pal [Pseudomonas]MCY4124266.1 peptidoglycan-associated lipoprotein Pal [Pseudomonas sp.]MDP9665739.1 peptidoglycan-associated lipoprotein [Pseudomonas cremoricolorata]AQW67743.1 peptidoglycan-associated lipoprotein [Pseudomonas parafulva]AUA32185.1 peptidoglycan-associated lipoprotein Pal [Pseudomonas sp. SGAir0191]AVF54668.1 peptidoglycan-associated lipoprotein Pal [Pseudomonas fulva]